jgi:hypothetical protein
MHLKDKRVCVSRRVVVSVTNGSAYLALKNDGMQERKKDDTRGTANLQKLEATAHGYQEKLGWQQERKKLIRHAAMTG